MTSISASLSAKFRQALPNNNRCTLYTTFQNPNWKERQATLNQTVMHICCKRSCKKKEQGVAHAAQAGCCPAWQIYAINTSSSKVLPKFRKRGVAPPGNICEYIHLLGIYHGKHHGKNLSRLRFSVPTAMVSPWQKPQNF